MDSRFCQDRIYAPHVTIYIVIFLPEIPCIHRVGQNHIYTVYIRYFGREITKYTVIYGVYIRFWPTLYIVISLPEIPYIHRIHMVLANNSGQ